MYWKTNSNEIIQFKNFLKGWYVRISVLLFWLLYTVLVPVLINIQYKEMFKERKIYSIPHTFHDSELL